MGKHIRIQDLPQVAKLVLRKYRENGSDYIDLADRRFLASSGLLATGRSLFLYNLGSVVSLIVLIGAVLLFWLRSPQDLVHRPPLVSLLEIAVPMLLVASGFVAARERSRALALGLRLGLSLGAVGYVPTCLFVWLNAAAQAWSGPETHPAGADWVAFAGSGAGALLLLWARLYAVWPRLRRRDVEGLSVSEQQGSQWRLRIAMAVCGIGFVILALTAHGVLIARYLAALR